jgi:hypothetical protein
MGLSSPEKSAKRQEVLEKEVAGHSLRQEAVPMIQQAFALWDDVQRTNDPWSLRDIEKFTEQCIVINVPIEKFRKDKAIHNDNDTYQNVFVFTNKWHVNYCTEAMQRLMEDLRKELEKVSGRAETIATEIRRYLGANMDGYVQQGERYKQFKKTVWEIVEDFKNIERVNDLIEKASKQRIDTDSAYKGAVTRAMGVLNEVRDDFFKHGDHHHSKRSSTFLFWTVVISMAALLLGVANFGLEWWKSSQTQRVEVQLEESVDDMLRRGGMIRLPRGE